MKILAITGTKRKGNSLIAASYIAKKLNAELEILNVVEKDIQPCKACYACLFGQECSIEDDVNEILQKIREADFVLISSPVYWLDLTGKMKMLLDRMFMALQYFEEFKNKKGAVVYFYGFEELRGWASNTYNTLLRVLGISPLAVVPIHAALPGEVLKDENVRKLDMLVDAIKSGKEIRFDGQCPVCFSEVFKPSGELLECPICHSKLSLSLEVVEAGKTLSYEWMVEHYDVLRKMKEMFLEQKDELKALRGHYGV
ncbi:Multimeric flavodoxin WrbA [Geoglobus ahangari]|uniref:Multimeric flavodoxin WrbA n=1 Tax=Geoglobus ahangari TaxID=113653 RepID=A0A0F7DBK6_9EURY|nr:flavodoxin family protein [Geoglobus ahangari]AKG91256.1 Multimeric flavodoxin WrbA [Geoglobus ahangari]